MAISEFKVNENNITVSPHICIQLFISTCGFKVIITQQVTYTASRCPAAVPENCAHYGVSLLRCWPDTAALDAWVLLSVADEESAEQIINLKMLRVI